MPPAIPGLGSQGGFSFWLQDRSGGIDREPRRDAAAVPRRGAPAARARHRQLAVQRRGAAGVRRRRSRQGAEGRHRPARRLPDAADLPRRPLRQPVQPLRPAVARLPAGRGRGADQPREHRPVLRPQQRRPDGADVVAADDAPDVRAAVHQPLQRLPGGAGHRHGGARLQLGPGPRRARGGRARDAAARLQLRLGRPLVPGAARLGQRARACSRCRSSSCS